MQKKENGFVFARIRYYKSKYGPCHGKRARIAGDISALKDMDIIVFSPNLGGWYTEPALVEKLGIAVYETLAQSEMQLLQKALITERARRA